MENVLEEQFVSIFGADHNIDDISTDVSNTHAEEYEENVDVEEGIGNASEHVDEAIPQEPQTNMEFESRESLFASYQAYAKSKGFSVVYRTTRKGNGSDELKYLLICCDKSRNVEAKKSTKKINCLARVNAIKQDNGFWKVSTVHSIHNHELEPSMSMFMPAHRSLSINMKRQLEGNDIAGLRVCKNVRLLEVQAGGPQNVGCSARDCRNFIDKRRRLRLGEGDAEAIRTLFMRMQQKDRSFFHLMDIDDEGRLRNVMWIHPRSKAAYEDFHDVVSFDTTYLVNQYRMPFATMVGVNHHNQSILLGCALLSHEDAESFKCLFINWLEAMGGVQPGAMLTDQAESIKIALREVMPDTIHRFCLWHIMSKTAQKFKGATNFSKAVKEFNSMVYGSLTIAEFEDRWDKFLLENGLQNNKWLSDLYVERQSWVHVYLNHTFWAGMVSTQRSESMHAFFDGYITSRSTLKTFVEQYEIAIGDKIHREMQADYESKTKIKKCISSFKWEEQFRKAYTANIFEILQKEIMLMLHCNVKQEVSNVLGIEVYGVLENGAEHNRQCTYTVEYRPNGEYVQCNCRKFECKGILCRHILKVLVVKDIQVVNERYVLRRWRKDVYRRHSSIFFSGGYPHMTDEYKRFQEMERAFIECTDLAFESPDKMKFIEQRCKDMKEELMNWTPTTTNTLSASLGTMGNQSVHSRTLLNPQQVRSRGRPKTNRMKSPIENNTNSIGFDGGRGRGRGRGKGRRAGSNLRDEQVVGTQGSSVH